jgi:hypothetical protein
MKAISKIVFIGLLLAFGVENCKNSHEKFG